MSDQDDALLASVMRKVIDADGFYLDGFGSYLRLDGYISGLTEGEAEAVARLYSVRREREEREFSTFQAATAPAVRGARITRDMDGYHFSLDGVEMDPVAFVEAAVAAGYEGMADEIRRMASLPGGSWATTHFDGRDTARGDAL